MIGASMSGVGLFQTLTRGERIEAATLHKLQVEAEQLAEAIRKAAPEDSGALRDSVRVEDGDEPLTVFVKAGGTPETTKVSEAGSFDEALMTEYGTSRSAAQPFFYPTIEQMRDTIKANIDGAMDDAAQEQ